MMLALAILGIALSPLSNREGWFITIMFFALLTLILAMRARCRRRGHIPYVASLPAGLFVSRTGRPMDVEKIQWSDVKSRVQDEDHPWRYGTDVLRDLDVHLDIAASREAYSEIVRRCELVDIHQAEVSPGAGAEGQA